MRNLRKVLLDYHQSRGFVLYDSFPLVSKDPTVLFTNATITPFKHFFQNPDVIPHDYALIQQCLRVGGGAGGLETAQKDPNYSSLFEMFGCGLFGRSYTEAVRYFLDMLGEVGLPKESLRFTVPDRSEFADALVVNGVERSSVFAITENGEFWQEWRFGRNGLVGKGLTAIFARDGHRVESVEEMVSSSRFVEIGNLIYVYGRAVGETIVPAVNKGFEVGIGIGRLAIAMEDKTLYELDSFRQFVEVVETQLKALGVAQPTAGLSRVVVDHLRSIEALVEEGVIPGNKHQAFVLRKLIRSLLEIIWLSANKIRVSENLVRAFSELNTPAYSRLTIMVVKEEERTFMETLERGRAILAKNPSLSSEALRDTYGVRQSLVPLIRGS